MTATWRARLNNGVVEYSAVRPPTPLQAARQLLGVDGGDWSAGRGVSHPDRPVDGGDFSAGALVTLPFPQVVEGGVFSAS